MTAGTALAPRRRGTPSPLTACRRRQMWEIQESRKPGQGPPPLRKGVWIVEESHVSTHGYSSYQCDAGGLQPTDKDLVPMYSTPHCLSASLKRPSLPANRFERCDWMAWARSRPHPSVCRLFHEAPIHCTISKKWALSADGMLAACSLANP
jgi:hypothetical protein